MGSVAGCPKEGRRVAEFYAHERLAKAAAQSMTMDPMVYENFSAYLVGSNGPDPMFFRVLWRFEGGGMGVQKLGAPPARRAVRALCPGARGPGEHAGAARVRAGIPLSLRPGPGHPSLRPLAVPAGRRLLHGGRARVPGGGDRLRALLQGQSQGGEPGAAGDGDGRLPGGAARGGGDRRAAAHGDPPRVRRQEDRARGVPQGVCPGPAGPSGT